MDPMTLMTCAKMGFELVGLFSHGQSEKHSGNHSPDAEPQMPQDSVHLSDPDDQQDDGLKNIGNILNVLCKVGEIAAAV